MAIYDNGRAPITESVGRDVSNIKKSFIDLSRVTNSNGIMGALMISDVMRTYPNEDYNLEYLYLVTTRNPLVKELRNGCKLYVQAYWNRGSDLWEDYEDYITKGRDGRHSVEIPKILPDFQDPLTSKINSTFTPSAPSSYMGIPVRAHTVKSTRNDNESYLPVDLDDDDTVIDTEMRKARDEKTKWGINALPFVMYNKIYRDYYANQNLLQSNTYWFPSNNPRFRLPKNCIHTAQEEDAWFEGSRHTFDYVNIIRTNDPLESSYTDNKYNYTPIGNDGKPYLNKLHFRQFKGDYFTTASPFADLLRGDRSDIDNETGKLFKFDWSLYEQHPAKLWGVSTGTLATGELKAQDSITWGGLTVTGETATDIMNRNGRLLEGLNNAITSTGYLNKLRKALVLERFMMRNGATNGSYREIIGAQWGYKPNVDDGKPTYIGGGFVDINFEPIVMNSSNTETQNTGDKVSIGKGSGSVNIGKFHSDDNGYLMVIASIVPDVYYNNNKLDRMFTDVTQEAEYFPITNNLGPQPILNKEIFVSGNYLNDNNIWGYTDRNAHLKSRQDIITGLASLNGNLTDSVSFIKRKFSTTPTLSNDFMTMSVENVDLTPFSSTKEIPFDIICGQKVTKMSPMPYESKPMEFGMNY